MNILDNQLPVMIQTKRGNIPMENLNIGDSVFSHEYGCEFEILGLRDTEERVYQVKFNDGRSTIYTGKELDYFDNRPIHQNRINYNHRIINPLHPDPYIAGALLIYGDQTDKYLNLPFDVNGVNNLFAHKYQLNYGGTVSENGNKYFRYNGSPVDKLISWEEFFSNYVFTGKPQNSQNPPIVPLEYQRASIHDRLKFIRGVFDMGYNKEYFRNCCGIKHNSKEKLVEVQKILWSLGILSIIDYDTSTSCLLKADKISTDITSLNSDGGIVNVDLLFKPPASYKGRDFSLYVLGEYSKYPGFFYNIDSIEHLIESNNNRRKCLKFKLEIESVESHGKKSMRNIILARPNVAFVTDNFLPKISGKK